MNLKIYTLLIFKFFIIIVINLGKKLIVLNFIKIIYKHTDYGRLAQLGERHVYTVDVVGSIPAGPT